MARISPSLSDIELVSHLRSGRREALTVLYDRYGALVYSLALRLLKKPTEAEDLTQEVFFDFWRKEHFDPDRGTLSTYLCTMTRSRGLNRLASHTRRQQSLQRIQPLLADSTAITPLEHATLAEQENTLRQALSYLSEQQQRVLELNFYQGCSHTAIAEQLDLPLGTVKSVARQGLKRLRQHLGATVEEGR